MKIINIVPGFGGTFYCGNCLRDSGFVLALRNSGYEAYTLPIYLPLSLDHCDKDEEMPVFYGAISIYLKQRFKWIRKMPKWFERFLNSGFFLDMAAKRAGSTRAAGLEDMTISMLKGHEGYQADELDMLIDFLKNEAKPDIVHLSNALLLGLAGKIKEELGIAVVCTLQDEDVWIDAMRPEYVQGLWDLMSEKGKDIDAFFPVSNYFGDVMKEKMRIPDEKMHTVYVGIELDEYSFSPPNTEKPVLGYLSRLNEENGFGLIIDAFIILKKTGKHPELTLKLTGGKTGDDHRYIKKQIKKLKRVGCFKDVEFVDAYEGEDKKAFLQSLTLLSVPVLNGEAFGLYQLEAIASGTPIVQPDLGAFPEIVQMAKGGVIYSPNTAAALSAKINELLLDPTRLKDLAVQGRKSLESQFNMSSQVEKMVQGYRNAIDHASKNVKS